MKTLTNKRGVWSYLAGGALLVCMMILFSNPTQGALIQLGSGYSVMSTHANPISNYFRNYHIQMYYYKAEINTAGQSGASSVSAFSWNTYQPGTLPLPNYTVKMKNTTQNGPIYGHDYGPFTTVLIIPSYSPGYGWNMQNFTTPFMWNGTGHILIDVCWDMISYWTYTGRVYQYYKPGGYPYYYARRYYYSDYSVVCNNYTYYSTTYSPQIKLQFGPTGPIPDCASDVIAGASPRPWISNECQTLSATGGYGSITWEYATASAAGPYSTLAGLYGTSADLIIQSTTDWTLWIRTKRYTKPGPNGTCYSTPIQVDVDCAAYITYGPFAGDYIGQVKITGSAGTLLNNYSGYKYCGAVSDYKGVITAPVLQQGGVYNMTVDAGGFWQQSHVVHIDWNGDDQYSTSEVVFGPTASSTSPMSGNFIVPCGLFVGQTVKMRVRCNYYSTVSTNACGGPTQYYGEIEEYNITIGPPVPDVPAVGGNTTIDGDQNPQWFGEGNEVFAIGLANWSGNINHWEYNTGGSPFWTTLSGVSCEPVNLKFNNYACGPNTIWKFRALVDGQGCNPGNAQYSTPVGVKIIPAMYLSQGGPCATGDYITDVKVPDAIPPTSNIGNGCKYLPQSCLGPYPYYGQTWSGNSQNFAEVTPSQSSAYNFTVCSGGTYELVMRNGSYYDPQGHAAWIDWNQNDQYDVGENMFTAAPLTSTPHNIDRVHLMSIPTTAFVGQTYRMRVLTAWNITPGKMPCYTPGDPYIGYTYGETEQYMISIGGVAPTVSLSFSSCTGLPGYCPGDCASLTITANTNIGNATYQWYLDGVPIPGATASSIGACSGPGVYKVKIVDPSTGCSNIATQNVVEFVPPEINQVGVSSSQVCCGEDITLGVDVEASYSSFDAGLPESSGWGLNTVYWGYYASSRHQQIIPASELIAAGYTAGSSFDAIGWNVQTWSGTNTFKNMTIRLGETTSTGYGSSYSPFFTNTTNYFGPQDFTTSSGWNVHDFNTPFVWNGGNIIVDVCHSGNSNYGSNSAVTMNLNYGSYVMKYYTSYGSSVCNNTYGYSLNYMPITRFIQYQSYVVTWTDENGDTVATGDTATITPKCEPCLTSHTYTVTVYDPATCCSSDESLDVEVAPNFLFAATTPCGKPDSIDMANGGCFAIIMGNDNMVTSGSIGAQHKGANVKIGNYNNVAWFLSADNVKIGKCNTIDGIWSNGFTENATGSCANGGSNDINTMTSPFDVTCDSMPDFVYGIACGPGQTNSSGNGPNDLVVRTGDTLNIYPGDYCKLKVKERGACDTDNIRKPPAVINFMGALPTTIPGPLKTVQLGSGTSVTGSSTASPINIWYRNVKTQQVYTASEMGTAGLGGAGTITAMGFYVYSRPTHNLPNFTLRLKHTTAVNAAVHDAGPFTTVLTVASYSPTAGGFDMLNLTTPFAWDGSSNIVLETCFDLVPYYNLTGRVRYYSFGYGNQRYYRSDYTSVCNYNYTGTYYYKPQLKMTVQEADQVYYPPADTFTFKLMDLGGCNIVNSNCNAAIFVDGDVRIGSNNIITGLKVYAKGRVHVGHNNTINGTFIADKFLVGKGNDLSISCCWTKFPPPPVQAVTFEILGASQSTVYYINPISDYHRGERMHYVYTKDEINAEGVFGPGTVTHVGFNITRVPKWANLNWNLRMKHTTDFVNMPATDPGPWTTVLTHSSYFPTSTGWDLQTLATTFDWDGVQNIKMEVCFGPNSTYQYSSNGGTVQSIYNSSYGNGFRYYYTSSTITSGCSLSYLYYDWNPSRRAVVQMTMLVGGAKAEKPEETAQAQLPDYEGINVYPNPFANTTTFSFNITEAGKATLDIFNMAGARVATAFEGTVDANSNHNVVFDAGDLPTGVYFYNLTTGTKVYRGKLTIAK